MEGARLLSYEECKSKLEQYLEGYRQFVRSLLEKYISEVTFLRQLETEYKIEFVFLFSRNYFNGLEKVLKRYAYTLGLLAQIETFKTMCYEMPDGSIVPVRPEDAEKYKQKPSSIYG